MSERSINSRLKARDYAYKLIFSYLFTGEEDEISIQDIEMDEEISDSDLKYIKTSFSNVVENRAIIEDMISKYANGFTLDRIFKPDLAVLMYAIGEMLYNKKVPHGVAINEAVNIIKKYSTTKSSSFVNGVLASVYKELN